MNPHPHAIRVGYCIDSFEIGGTELNAVRTLEALDRERFAVTVFHLQQDGPLRQRYEALGVRMIHLPLTSLHAPRTAAQGLRLAGILRDSQIRILHTHDVYTNIFATPWARMLGRCRAIASRRWLYEVPRPGLNRLNRWSYRFAERVLANSPAVARLLIEQEGIPPRKIVELPNFLEERAFQHADDAAREAQRRQWGIPAGSLVAGTVARLAAVKNHELLLRAAQLVEGLHVVLIGDGPERARLEALTDELGLRARVHFAGSVVPTVNLHQFLDVSVLCSHSEGFPNAVIEALAAARAIVATAAGGIADVITEGETGFLVPADEPRVLAERLRQLSADPLLRERLGRAGCVRVRARYHESIVMRHLSALYRQLDEPLADKRARLQ